MAWADSKNALAVRAYKERNRDLVLQRQRTYSANRRAREFGVPGKLTVEDVRAVLTDAKCVGCGITERLTIDHVVAMSEGGHNVRENLQPLCRACNASKHRTDRAWRWSRQYDACQMCGGTERAHGGRGFCFTCYQRVRLGRSGRRHAA